ncbi:MAG: carbohydrate ABC transporter permease [Geminicoccaceae bacterium]
MSRERGGWRGPLRPRSPLEPSPLSMAVSYVILGFWAFVVLFPFYWVFITSFKQPLDVADGPFYLMWVDFQPSLHAWKYIFVDLGHDTFGPYLNTVIVALTSSALALILGSMAGYGLARIQYRPRLGNVLLFAGCVVLAAAATVGLGLAWPIALAAALALFVLLLQTVGRRFKRALGNDDIAFWMISQRILPPVAVVIPVYVLFQQIGLRDSLLALIITYVAVNLPIVVWLMRDFFQSIPLELEESAMIDGASRFVIFRRIVLPISRPSLASAFLLMLILTWNEYLLALMLSTADTQTLPLLIAAQNATRGPQWWYMSVLILIMVVPVVVMAIALERYIRRGMLIGAVKG